MISPITISVTLFVLALWLVHRRRQSESRLPPGPKGWPVIGNLLDMPLDYPWVTYAVWGRRYGPITYLNVARTPILILNSHRVAIDLLEKRGQTYAGRPRSVMLELVGKNLSFK